MVSIVQIGMKSPSRPRCRWLGVHSHRRRLSTTFWAEFLPEQRTIRAGILDGQYCSDRDEVPVTTALPLAWRPQPPPTPEHHLLGRVSSRATNHSRRNT